MFIENISHILCILYALMQALGSSKRPVHYHPMALLSSGRSPTAAWGDGTSSRRPTSAAHSHGSSGSWRRSQAAQAAGSDSVGIGARPRPTKKPEPV